MRKLVTLLTVGATTLIGLVSGPGVALARTPEATPQASVQSVPPGYRGHSYYYTLDGCEARGRRGLEAGEYTFWECHRDGWGGALEWHLVVSEECPICRRD